MNILVFDSILCYNIYACNTYREKEIGLYYLQSRYYDATVGRFINGDNASIICLLQDYILSCNVFTFCKNDSINFVDELGLFSFKDIKNFLAKIINNIKNHLRDYIKSVFAISRRKIQISTSVFASLFNALIGMLIRKHVASAFNLGLKLFKNTYLVRNNSATINIMKQIINFLLDSGLGKFVVYIISKIIVGKAGLSFGFIDILSGRMLTNIACYNNKLLNKVKIVLSAFSSIGNILAFVFCDLPDGSIDGKLTITW